MNANNDVLKDTANVLFSFSFEWFVHSFAELSFFDSGETKIQEDIIFPR